MGNLASNIGNAISSVFQPLWDFITNALDWLNPFSEHFILKKLWDFLRTIISYINPFDENFLGEKIIELLGNLLKALFIPKDDFFSSHIEDIKYKISQKIPYQDYVNLFETIKTVSTGNDLSIDLPEYKISNDLKIQQKDFVNFGNITKYKNTWYRLGAWFYIYILNNI